MNGFIKKASIDTQIKQYDPKKKGEYNSLMNQFDSAFGFIPGITGNEKVTELSGHWFAGAAKKALKAARPTADDPNGDIAYAKVRSHLDSIYGQDIDSAADALARLKEVRESKSTLKASVR